MLDIINLYLSIITFLIVILFVLIIIILEFCINPDHRGQIESVKKENIWKKSKSFEIDENKV
jgi:preprotein translocase subunit SecG